MRDMLQELLGGGTGAAGARRAPAGGTAAAGRGDVSDVVSGIYQIQAYEDSTALVVICKTEESFEFLDALIEDLDQPVFPMLPIVVELKHANAELVADTVNVILAPSGARVELPRQQTGLRGIDVGGGLTESETGIAGSTGETGTGGTTTEAGTMTFPWQQARPTEDEAEPSSLIGKVRVVPIHRQNAVMILASPEYRDAVRGLVEDLDKPGRRVMIAAIIAEVQLNDDLALGVRFSDSPAVRTGELPDYRLGGFADFLGQATDVLSGLFDTSTLDVNTSVQVAIQALAQKTKLRVIQEPRVFTADNQEAAFFEGRDVPILTTSQVTDVGTVTESVEYVAIGVGLNVRPRITSHGDIDLEVNLKLSNIDPSGEILESPVFQRRETSTQIIVRNGQTVVISGILRDEESRIDRKVPLLGDVPLFGELFKSREYGTTRTELLAFITPVIVDNPTENDSNFNVPARQRLEDLVRPLKEQDIRELDPERVRQRLLHHQFGYGPPRVPEEG
jgi:general secretion pathway protein D